MDCLNLHKLFGDRYQIGCDPAYSLNCRTPARCDPAMLTVLCRYAEMYPYDDSRLVVEVVGHPAIAKRLREFLDVHQDGDMEHSFFFELPQFEEVAAIVQPRRRRHQSPKQRDIARRQMREINRRKAVPEQSSAPGEPRCKQDDLRVKPTSIRDSALPSSELEPLADEAGKTSKVAAV